jgi:hypothetical protein
VYVIDDPLAVSYERAKAAYDAGQKLHLGGRIYLVRPVPKEAEDGLVLWVVDERTLGDQGLLLYPDGRVEQKRVR